ncbi:MAG: hypothetical protein JY451_07620 [Erythrobacter sp.]|nr:MAG: hypothetical protein JY451_07620 [Erythrobacter sp.]
MLKKIFASFAAAGLAFAPIAAQANTRSSDAVVSFDRAAVPVGMAEGVIDDDDDDFGGLWWLFGGAIVVGLIFVIAGDVDEDNASPGAN